MKASLCLSLILLFFFGCGEITDPSFEITTDLGNELFEYNGNTYIKFNDGSIAPTIIDKHGNVKVIICHYPNKDESKRMTAVVPEEAVEGHIQHGDFIGYCDDLYVPIGLSYPNFSSNINFNDYWQSLQPTVESAYPVTFNISSIIYNGQPIISEFIRINNDNGIIIVDENSNLYPGEYLLDIVVSNQVGETLFSSIKKIFIEQVTTILFREDFEDEDNGSLTGIADGVFPVDWWVEIPGVTSSFPYGALNGKLEVRDGQLYGERLFHCCTEIGAGFQSGTFDIEGYDNITIDYDVIVQNIDNRRSSFGISLAIIKQDGSRRNLPIQHIRGSYDDTYTFREPNNYDFRESFLFHPESDDKKMVIYGGFKGTALYDTDVKWYLDNIVIKSN